MALLRIRQFGDPALRESARVVEAVTDTHRTLIADMIETMRDAPGVGLAAPQVGVLERIFVWEVEGQVGAVINPVIVERSADEAEFDEGCLSLPGISYPVVRPSEVTVEGLDENGEPLRIEATALRARVFQHESDHLDGVLFIDHLSKRQRREAMRRLTEFAMGLGPTLEQHPGADL